MENPQESEPSPKPNADRVFLDPEIIEIHLHNGRPVQAEKALIIWLMNRVIDNPETTEGGW